MRSAAELRDPDDAWPLVSEWVAASPWQVEVLQASLEDRDACLEGLQVTTRSPLGAVAASCGGILIDRGWLRVLGAGAPRLPRSIVAWNRGPGGGPRSDVGLIVADDALGGAFVWANATRTIHYLAPDTLAWEDLGVGYSDWLAWALSERLAGFVADLRWSGWEEEVAGLPGERCVSIWPPLVLEGPPLVDRSRRPVPAEEAWSLALDLQAQLADLPPGTKVRIEVGD